MDLNNIRYVSEREQAKDIKIMRKLITKFLAITFFLAFLFMHTNYAYARNLPTTRSKNIETSFNVKNDEIEIIINSKFQRNIYMQINAGSYKFILKSNISNLSLKKNKVYNINLTGVEQTTKENKKIILKDIGKIKKTNNKKYGYRIHYVIPLKSLDDNLDSSAIINFKILHPIRKNHITTISLCIPPWISILISLICVGCFSSFRLQQLKK